MRECGTMHTIEHAFERLTKRGMLLYELFWSLTLIRYRASWGDFPAMAPRRYQYEGYAILTLVEPLCLIRLSSSGRIMAEQVETNGLSSVHQSPWVSIRASHKFYRSDHR